MAARDKVLSTFELIENIALHLPLRQLLLAQRVNKAFFDVVNNSHDIGRALFLKPTECDGTTGSIVNPFFYAHMHEFDHDASLTTFLKGASEDDFLWTWTTDEKVGFSCRRPQAGEPRATTTRDKMALISAPSKVLEVTRWNDRVEATIGNDVTPTYGDLMMYALSHWPYDPDEDSEDLFGKDSNRAMVYEFDYSLRWLWTRGSIDSITGHEMLKTLDNNDGLPSSALRAARNMSNSVWLGTDPLLVRWPIKAP